MGGRGDNVDDKTYYGMMEKKNRCFKIDKNRNPETLLAQCIFYKEIV